MPLDHTLFLPESISPQTAAFNAELGRLMAKAPPAGDDPVEMRRRHREGRPWQPAAPKLDWAQEDSCPGTGGPIPLRIFTPDVCNGAYLHIHGGGFIFGGYDLQDDILWRMTQAGSVAVVSVEYRLAPEHPYPAGPDDCEVAAHWLISNSRSRFGTDRLLNGGESAGGNLSAVTVLRMRDRYGYTDWAGVDLVYGAFDFTGACPSRELIGRNGLVLSKPGMERVQAQYLGDADRDDPYVSPMHASLDGLPPARFSCGTSDRLIDDTLFMYSRWMAAGNPAEIAIYPGGTRAFDEFRAPLADASYERRYKFIPQVLG